MENANDPTSIATAHQIHHPQQQQVLEAPLSRRQKAARGALAKIDSVYASVHALETISNLLNDACSYIQTVSRLLKKSGAETKKLRLPCECLRVAIDGLEQHGSIITQAIVNTSDTKEVVYAQTKLIKSQKRQKAQRRNPRGVMERDPKEVLTSSMEYAKETLEDILEKMNPDFITEKSLRAKKRKRMEKKNSENNGTVAKEEGATDEGGERSSKKQKGDSEMNEEDDAIDVIDLPIPYEGAKMYSPLEASAYITHMMEQTRSNKVYLRAYKEKIMEKKLVPIQKSQLNALVKQYGGQNKPVAPLNWNERGAKEVCWESLLSQFQTKQSQGQSWSIDDTRNALTSAAIENKKKEPTKKIIETHHSTLILLHKRQNHITEQLHLQEQRLRENPPAKLAKKSVDIKSLPRLKFDKNAKKYRKIKLPPPEDGRLIYTPAEAVANITKFINGKPAPSRTEVRAFKEKMIAEKIVPISISQLNYLVQTYGGPDKEPPKSWNAKGAEELISIEDLAKRVDESQIMWTIDNTFDIVWAEKREKFSKKGTPLEQIKQPDKKTVNAYHTALLSIPEIAHKVVKPEIIRLKPGPKVKNYHPGP